jgi:8-oxo-dGTP diphosphatase
METDINLHIVLVQSWIRKENKFLMAQRKLDDLQAPGVWSIPGGKVDNEFSDQIVEETLKKEILEEVGVEVSDNFKYIGSRAFVRSSGHHVIGLSFIVEYKAGEAKPLEDQNAVKWCSVEEVEGILTQANGAKYMLKDLVFLKESLKTN